jgi:hypothetical protein
MFSDTQKAGKALEIQNLLKELRALLLQQGASTKVRLTYSPTMDLLQITVNIRNAVAATLFFKILAVLCWQLCAGSSALAVLCWQPCAGSPVLAVQS